MTDSQLMIKRFEQAKTVILEKVENEINFLVLLSKGGIYEEKREFIIRHNKDIIKLEKVANDLADAIEVIKIYPFLTYDNE
jgi:hypothetical protein